MASVADATHAPVGGDGGALVELGQRSRARRKRLR